MKLFELQRARAEKLTEARTLVTKAIDEARALTPEEKTKVDELRTAAEDLSRKIELFELRDSFGDAGAAAGSDGADTRGRLNPGDRGTDLPDLDGRHPYSVLRALRIMMDLREGRPGAKLDGIEGEVHQALLESREDRSAKGILIPWSLANPRQARALAGREQRDLTTTGAAGGIANILGTPLIEYLRNKMVMNALGARILSGLTGGSFALPKQTAVETAYHVAEGIAPTASQLTLGQIVWTPRTLAARTIVSRKTVLQTSMDIEMLVRESIVLTLVREFDRVGVNGSGQSSVPLGIMQDPNVVTSAIGTNGGAPTWAMVCDLESKVAQGNADFGKLAYLTSNKGRSVLKRTTKIASSQYSDFLWQSGSAYGEGEVNSYRALSSEQVPSNLAKGSGTGLTALIFGNFDSATYGLWSGIDVVVDPYTAANVGAWVINCFQDYDFQMRWEAAFAKCVDIDPT